MIDAGNCPKCNGIMQANRANVHLAYQISTRIHATCIRCGCSIAISVVDEKGVDP